MLNDNILQIRNYSGTGHELSLVGNNSDVALLIISEDHAAISQAISCDGHSLLSYTGAFIQCRRTVCYNLASHCDRGQFAIEIAKDRRY